MSDDFTVTVLHHDDPDLERKLAELNEPFPEDVALLERINIDPKVVFGKPRIDGTRIWVGFILGLLRQGQSREEIAESYGLTVEDVQAALYYAETVVAEKQQPLEWSKRRRRTEAVDTGSGGEGLG